MRWFLMITLILVAHGLAYGNWFLNKFDSNGDGYVVLKEFPGSTEAFRTLDANGDGLIGAGEAPKAPASSLGSDVRAVIIAPGVVKWVPRGAAVRRARELHGKKVIRGKARVAHPRAKAARARKLGVVPKKKPAPGRRRPLP